jgi:hypothetical protein
VAGECGAAAVASGIPEAMAPVCVTTPATVMLACRSASGALGVFTNTMMGGVATEACSHMTGR